MKNDNLNLFFALITSKLFIVIYRIIIESNIICDIVNIVNTIIIKMIIINKKISI